MTPWLAAIDKLRSHCYSIMLTDGKLRYTYRGKDAPPKNEIISLFEVLKAHKREILNDPCFLIEQTLEEINRGWQPGALEWVKTNRLEAWAEIRQTEEAINNSTLSGDTLGLRQALNQYREIWSRMIREREADKGKPGPEGTQKEDTGNLFDFTN